MGEKICRFGEPTDQVDQSVIMIFCVLVNSADECQEVKGSKIVKGKKEANGSGLVGVVACSMTRSMMKCPRNIKTDV